MRKVVAGGAEQRYLCSLMKGLAPRSLLQMLKQHYKQPLQMPSRLQPLMEKK